MTSSLSLRILTSLLVAGSACAAPAATVVYPTGSYPLDVQNVQAALDGGGTVLLKATDAGGAPTRSISARPLSLAAGWSST